MTRLLVTFLEMRAPPELTAMAPPAAAVAREHWQVDEYLSFYRSVGAPVKWDMRLHQSRAEVEALLRRDDHDLFIARADGVPVGLCEFDRSVFPQIELVHFGLLPSAQRRGLGRFLLHRALGAAWAHGPTRIWLHTDTDDDPRAIPLYERMGFRRYDQRYIDFADLPA